MNSNEENLCTSSSNEEEEATADPIEEIIENFQPIPYTFTLKDCFGTKVLYDSDEIRNVRVCCPPFHLLLDHVLAVLWILYSGEGISHLQTSHLHWTLKFLEGLKDNHNKHTPDIGMIIEHLKTILINLYAQVDIEELEKQNNTHREEYTKQLNSSIGRSNKTYTDFIGNLQVCQEKNLMNPTPLKPCQECPDEKSAADCKSENLESCSQSQPNIDLLMDCPSIIVQDMLDKEPRILNKILYETFHPEECPEPENLEEECQILPVDPPPPTTRPSQTASNIMAWRVKQYELVISRLELMQQIDDQLKCLNCTASPEIIQNLEEFLCKQKKEAEDINKSPKN